MRKLPIALVCIFCIFIVFIALFKENQTIETITYFPLDEQLSFTKSETFFDTCPDDNDQICWKIQSDIPHPIYLRQDIGITFVNGKVGAILTKWEQNKAEVTLEKTLPITPNSYLQAISFHHGEIHHENESITSIQEMSTKNAFVLKTTDKKTLLTDQSATRTKDIQEKLLFDTENTLDMVWNRWIREQEIQQEKYELIPLVSLQKYNQKPLPRFTQVETDKIIGQLWEGLYKSYLIPFIEEGTNEHKDHMPIILLSKDKTHLIVLYEQNNEAMSLYQRINLATDEPAITISSNE